jgi:hypothetical protein
MIKFLMYAFLWIVGGKKGRQELRELKEWEREQIRRQNEQLARTIKACDQIMEKSLRDLEEFAHNL